MTVWERIGASDDWHTPAYIFLALGEEFDLDVAAPEAGPRYVPAKAWNFERSLEREWFGFVWMNAPFGGRNGLVPWLDKFMAHGNGIALVPDRTSAPWFQRAACFSDAILFISPRIKFERLDGSVGKSPGSGVALLARGERGVMALRRARHLGLLMRRAP